MRIQFFGDLAATGFGTVTMDLGRELLNIGHDIRFVSQNNLGNLPEPFDSRTFRVTAEMADPARAEAVGLNSMSLLGKNIIGLLDGSIWEDGWKPEAAIMLGDFWGVSDFVLASPEMTAAFRSIPTFHYVPIEGIDLPPAWKRLWDVIHPIAMSAFGAEQIRLVMGERPPFVYHGVDTETFRPVSPEQPLYMGEAKLRTKAECKRWFGANPKARWVLRTDRYMPRKRYASLLRAMGPVMAQRPDVFLVLHCRSVDEGGHLHDQISKMHPAIQKRVVSTGFHDNGHLAPREVLTALYNAADVYASPSAEGFGLTIAEAMACGTPAVGMDYSSVTEVIGPGGLLAPVNHLVDNEYDHAWAAVNEVEFSKQVATLLDDGPLRARLGRQARSHVVDSFSWAQAALQFSTIIRERTAVEVAA